IDGARQCLDCVGTIQPGDGLSDPGQVTRLPAPAQPDSTHDCLDLVHATRRRWTAPSPGRLSSMDPIRQNRSTISSSSEVPAAYSTAVWSNLTPAHRSGTARSTGPPARSAYPARNAPSTTGSG